MTSNKSIFLQSRQITLTEFGYIAAIREFRDCVEISNSEGATLRMKKAYHRWPKALAKCKGFMTKNIEVVTRCGAETLPEKHFNEVYINPPGAPLLNFPKDGKNAPETVEQLIMERVWKQEVWAEDIRNTVDLVAERDRFQASIQIQSERDKYLTNRTTGFLNLHFTKLSMKRVIYLRIDKRTRRRAAMRLGIDLSGHSNLKVHLEGHLYNTNYLHVTLPEFGGIDGVIGLHRNEDGNQWISTVNNGDKDWWKHESKVATHKKDVDEPITHYLSLFAKIQSSRYGWLATKEHDHKKTQTVIKFPKNPNP